MIFEYKGFTVLSGDNGRFYACMVNDGKNNLYITTSKKLLPIHKLDHMTGDGKNFTTVHKVMVAIDEIIFEQPERFI